MKEKTCAFCGKTFIPKKSKQKYCSHRCAADSAIKFVKCEYCGKLFRDTEGHKLRFCSRSCSGKARHEKSLLNPKPEPVVFHKICEWCGNEFITNMPSQKYCSKECGYQGFLRLKRLQWAEKYKPKTFICKECGTEFITECGKPRSVFCCQSCSEKADRRKEHTTERHKKYMHRYQAKREKQLSENFVEDVSYDEIFKRDEGICQICGLPVIFDKHADNNWSGTIDHIIPVSLNGEHSMKNCQLAHRVCNSLKSQETNDYRINWEIKSKENNYWNGKYRSLKRFIGQPA